MGDELRTFSAESFTRAGAEEREDGLPTFSASAFTRTSDAPHTPFKIKGFTSNDEYEAAINETEDPAGEIARTANAAIYARMFGLSTQEAYDLEPELSKELTKSETYDPVGIFQYWADGLNSGLDANERGELEFLQFLGNSDPWVQTKIDTIREREVEWAASANKYGEGLLSTAIDPEKRVDWKQVRQTPARMIRSGLELAPLMVSGLREGFEKGVIGGGVAGGTALALGLPLNAAPVVGQAAYVTSAVGAASSGFGVGFTEGTMENIFRKETGLAYGEFKEIQLADGTTLNPQLARVGAAGVGIINTLIEALQIRRLAPGLSKAITGSMVDATKKGALRVLEDIGIETGQELLQESVNIFFGVATKKVDEWIRDVDPRLSEVWNSEFIQKELIPRLIQTAEKAAGGFGALIGGRVLAARVGITATETEKVIHEARVEAQRERVLRPTVRQELLDADIDRAELSERAKRTLEVQEATGWTQEESERATALSDLFARSVGIDLDTFYESALAGVTNKMFKDQADSILFQKAPPVLEAGVKEPDMLARLAEFETTIPGFRNISPYLTDAEVGLLSQKNAEKLVQVFDSLPSAEQFGAAALAGLAKRGWYKNSARALSEIFGAEDAVRFSSLLAALSPQTSVEANTLNTLNVWRTWVENGRPADESGIITAMRDAVQKTPLADRAITQLDATISRANKMFKARIPKGGDKATKISNISSRLSQAQIDELSILPSWINNTVRALQSEDPRNLVISGPKVQSFTQNLRGNTIEVTNDTWMALFALMNQRTIGGLGRKAPGQPGVTVDSKILFKNPEYIAFSAQVRRAADRLTTITGERWTAAEVQETVWSFSKALIELRQQKGERRTTGELLDTPEFQTRLDETPDFEVLFTQGVYAEVLKAIGLGREVEGVRRIVEGRETTERVDAGGLQPAAATAAEVGQFDFAQEIGRTVARLESIYTERTGSDRNEGGSRPGHFVRKGPGAVGGLGPQLRGVAKDVWGPPQAQNNPDLNRAAFDENLVELKTTRTGAARYAEAVRNAKEKNRHGAAVELKTVADYTHMKHLFITEDGAAGVAVKEDGDLVSVFSEKKNPLWGEARTQSPAPQLILLAIQNGAKKLDCFNTVLPKYYSMFGFRPVARIPWVEEYAPPGWEKEIFAEYADGEPDVVFMVYRGGDPETLPIRYGSFQKLTYDDVLTVPEFDDYDAAVELQERMQAIDNLQFSKEGGIVRGATKTLEDGKKVIYINKNAGDFDTWVHELAHVIQPYFMHKLTTEERTILEEHLGVNQGEDWNESNHEQFAEDVVVFLRDAEAPTPQLRPILEAFKQWLRRVVTGVGIDSLSPEVMQVYQQLLLTPEETAILRIRTPSVIRAAEGIALAEARTLKIDQLMAESEDEPGRRELRQALAAGRREGVAQVQQRQQEAVRLKRAREEGRKEVRKIKKDLKEAEKLARSGKVSPEHLGPIREVLAGIDLVQRRQPATLQRLEQTQRYLESNPDAEVPQRVVDELDILKKTPMGDMTLQQLRDVHNLVMHHVHLEKKKQELIVGKRRRNKEQAVAEAQEQLAPLAEDIPETVAFAEKQVGRPFKRLPSWLKTWWSRQLQYDWLVERVAGRQSIMQKMFVDAIDAGTDAVRRHVQRVIPKFTDAVITAANANGVQDVHTWWNEISDYTLDSGTKLQLSRGQKMALWNHGRIEYNRAAVLEGGIASRTGPRGIRNKIFRITESDLNRIMESMTPAELAVAGSPVAQHFFDQGESVKPTFRAQNGYEFESIEEGEYYPIDTVPTEYGVTAEAEEAQRRFKKGEWTRIGLTKGHLKQRTGATTAVYVNDLAYDVQESTEWAANYIGLEVPLSQASGLLYDRDFGRSVRALKDGDLIWAQFEEGLRNVAQQWEQVAEFEKGMLWVKNSMSKAMLPRITTFLRQTLSFAWYWPYGDARFLAEGAGEFAAHPKEVMRRHSIHSPKFVERKEQGGVREVSDALRVRDTTAKLFGKRGFVDYSMAGLRAMDIATVAAGMEGLVQMVLSQMDAGQLSAFVADIIGAEIPTTPEAQMAKAYQYADYATDRSQPSSAALHQSLASQGTPFERLITHFTAATNKGLNVLSRTITEARRSGDPKARLRAAEAIIGVIFINALGSAGIDELRDQLQGKGGSRSFVLRMVRSVAGLVTIVRDVVSSAISKIEFGAFGRDPNLPVSRLVSLMSEILANTYNAIDPENSDERRISSMKKAIDDALDLTLIAWQKPVTLKDIPLNIYRRIKDLEDR